MAQREYMVTWCIELTADTPEAAARQALEIQRDPASLATVFQVQAGGDGEPQLDIDIDLAEGRDV